MSNQWRLSSGGRPPLSPQPRSIILKRAGGGERAAQVERADAIDVVVNLTKKTKTDIAGGGSGGEERAPPTGDE